MSYGRVGTPEEIAAARKVLAGLQWAPLNPTNDNQLLPIRILEANKIDDEGQGRRQARRLTRRRSKIAALEAEIKGYQEAADKADKSAYKKMQAQFLEADKAGKQDELKKLIGQFAANAVNPAMN